LHQNIFYQQKSITIMKKIIFSLLSVVLALASCGDSAKDVNRIIVDQLQKTADKMEIISRHISNDHYEGAQTAIDSLAAQITAAKATIAALSNAKAEAYKQSALDYLTFIENEAASTFGKAIGMFEAAKVREENDIASRKQSPNLINSGPDFDEARKVVKDFMKELKKRHETVIEKHEKFVKANNIH
jgi:polyhydroxyalkanoate synthesis regulator phasin